jgi:tetrahydromethanopterin S-methyltransferase subunit B
VLETVWDEINVALTTGYISNTVWVIIVALVLVVLFVLLFKLGG